MQKSQGGRVNIENHSSRSAVIVCQTNRYVRNFLLIGAALWGLAGLGCQPPSSSGPEKTSEQTPKNTAEPSTETAVENTVVSSTQGAQTPHQQEDPYLEGWEKPACALVLTGEIHGYLEPCGCSPTQSGGFARRGSLLKELEKNGWPVAALDVGGLLKRSRRQDQIKFETMLDGMYEMKYVATGLGTEELLLGPDYLLPLYVPDDPKSIPFLGANIVFFDVPDLGVPLHYKVLQVGDVKVGVTAVYGLSHKDTVAPDGVQTNITITSPQEALTKVLPQLQAENPDFLVLLSYGTEEEAKKLAEEFPEFPIILTAGSPEDPIGKPMEVNKSWILETGMKGRSVGVLGYYPDHKDHPFQFEVIELNKQRFPIDDRMVDLMRKYQQRIIDENISVTDPGLGPHPTGWKFVGSEQCGTCHKKAFEHWKTTGHGKATETLIHGRPGEEAHWVPRLHDPECLSCHVVGWEPQQYQRYESGYVSEEATPHLRHQGCENCHGPGSKHTEIEQAFAANASSVSEADLETFRKAVRRSYETAEKQMCVQCHDAENSPKFDFENDWEKIEHPWRD